MAGEITTTLVVNFQSGTGEKGFLSAQVDGREDGFNLGQTTFTAGDQPVYLIFKTTNVVVTSQLPSFGNIAFHASGILEVEQTLQFAKTREARLSQPAIPGTIVEKWIGNNLGPLTLQDDELTVLSAVGNGVGVCKVTYQATFEAFRLTNIIVPEPANNESAFPVLIVIEGVKS